MTRPASCNPDGSYRRANQANKSSLSLNGHRFSAQAFFIYLAEGKAETESPDAPTNARVPGGQLASSA